MSPAIMSNALFAFNWLPASYAHRDWLGPWTTLLEQRDDVDERVVRRASAALLQRFDLHTRWIVEMPRESWMLATPAQLRTLATELGSAMVGGWVRKTLERTTVMRQDRLLGTQGRAHCIALSERFRHLPHPMKPWPIPIDSPRSIIHLGASCLAALLESRHTGARERFCFRFPAHSIVALDLLPEQMDDASALISANANGAEP